MFGGGVFNVGDDLLRLYVFHSALLLLKMLFMPLITSYFRQTRKIFANPEDARGAWGKVGVDEDVERSRRAHLNDMEGIYLFIFNAGFYLTTQPDLWTATWLFRIYTFCRYFHTCVYVRETPQPARGGPWMLSHAIQFYLVYCTLRHFW